MSLKEPYRAGAKLAAGKDGRVHPRKRGEKPITVSGWGIWKVVGEDGREYMAATYRKKLEIIGMVNQDEP